VSVRTISWSVGKTWNLNGYDPSKRQEQECIHIERLFNKDKNQGQVGCSPGIPSTLNLLKELSLKGKLKGWVTFSSIERQDGRVSASTGEGRTKS